MGRIIKLLFSLVFFFLLFPVSAFAKSFYFPNVSIDIQVNRDSSINVVEKRTSSFDGSFSKIYWDVPLRSDQEIKDVGFSEDSNIYQMIPFPDESRPFQKFVANRNGNTEHIEAYHSSNNETKTFTLSYSLTNAITSYNDVAEFYWKVIGDGWGAKTDSVEVVIHLPDKVLIDQIYVWGHGPLNGMGEIVDGSTAKFSVKNLPAKKFVEVRILFPSSIIVSGPRESKIVLEGIKQEEKSFQEKTVISQRIKVGGLIVLGIILFGWIIFWYRMWYKHGRDYYPGIPKYVHDPPSKLEPALVEALVTQGENITGNAFSATILDLARKKYIKIEAKEKISKGLLGIGVGKLSYGYVLHIDMKRYISKKGLGPFEQQVFKTID